MPRAGPLRAAPTQKRASPCPVSTPAIKYQLKLCPACCPTPQVFAASLGLLQHSLTRSAPAAAPHVALLALLLLTGCIAGTASRHLPAFRWDSQRAVAAFCALNAALYAGAAVRLQVCQQRRS